MITIGDNLLERTVNGETESFVYDNNVISMSKQGNNFYYLQDELGSPMYMTGTDGVAVSSYAFDDFGRNIDPFTGKIKENNKHGYTKQGNIIQPFAFTGYQEDAVSGLKFAQARYYSADNGRFQSEDNVRGFIDSPFTLNHYGYCWENPIGWGDLDGNMPDWLQGVYAHMAIEADMKVKDGNETTDVRSNVFIKGGGKGRTLTENGIADVVMKSGYVYSVYEIKPKTQNKQYYNKKGLPIKSPGQMQLEGYVQGINSNISAGGNIGQFGSTNELETAVEGTKKIANRKVYSSFIKNSVVIYSSDGSGMIYYDVKKVSKEEYERAPAIVKYKEELRKNAEQSVKIIARVCDGIIGLGEMMLGLLCIIPVSALVLDNGTLVGFIDDPAIPLLGAFGSGLWIDGYNRLGRSIAGCGY